MHLLQIATLVISSVAALVAAHPQLYGHADLHKATRDLADTPIPYSGGIKLCSGANWTDWCFYKSDPIGACYTWQYTFMWIDSVISEPDLACYLYSGRYCGGADIIFVPSIGGFYDLGAVDWLDNMESFQCFNVSDDPLPSISDVGVSKIASTGAADVTPATADWPFVGVPLDDGSVSKLVAAEAIHTNATHTRATHANHTTSVRDSELSTAESNMLPTSSIEERGNPGGCYICSQINWGGECDYVLPMMGTCYSLEDWTFNVMSYGPDQQANCWISNDFACAGSHQLLVVYPGLPDLHNDGYPYEMGSFRCEFQYDPPAGGDVQVSKNASVGSKVSTTKEEDGCCSATIALPAPTGKVARPGGPLPVGNQTRPGAHLPN